MNQRCETCAVEQAGPQHLNDRVVEYEKKLREMGQQPTLAALFLLYFITSVAVISLITYLLMA